MDPNGRLKYSSLKYDLNDLFIRTPLFDTPPIDFELENKISEQGLKPEDLGGWAKISHLILQDNQYRMKYVKNYEKVKQAITKTGYVPFEFKVHDTFI